jgi:hypothetical protein
MKLTRGRRILAMVAVPLALFVSLVAWGFSSPVGSSPDDDYHLASIWCGAGIREGLCEAGDKPNERRVPATLLEFSACYAFNANQSASCPQKPTSVLVNSSRGNFEASYPPIFYGTMSIFAGPDVATSVLLMRAFNALLFVGISSALFFSLTRGGRGPLLLGGLVTVVPLGMFLVPSVNPSSWAVTSAFTLWVSLLAFFHTDERKKKVIFGVIAIAMTVAAAGARSDAAVYSILAAVVTVILALRKSWRPDWLRVAIVPTAVITIAAAFFLTSGQSAVLSPETGPDVSRTIGAVLQFTVLNAIKLPELWAGVFGTWGLGWLDTILPGSVWVSMLVAFAGLLLWGLQKIDQRKAIALAIVFITLVVVPLYVLVKDNVIVGAAVQPRYVYPLVIMLVGIALVGFASDHLGLNRVQLACVSVLVVAANTVALHFNIRRYVTGVDGQGANLDSGVEWWWDLVVSPMGMWVIGSGAFAAAIAGIYFYLSASYRTAQELAENRSELAR